MHHIVQRKRGPATASEVSERRLQVRGAYVNDKQYLLGIRRGGQQLMRPNFDNGDISSLWLPTARLARKSGSIHQSFNAVLHVQQLGDVARHDRECTTFVERWTSPQGH